MISSHSRLSDWLRGVAGKSNNNNCSRNIFHCSAQKRRTDKSSLHNARFASHSVNKRAAITLTLALTRLFHSAGEKAEEDNGKLLYKLNNLQNIFTIQHSAMLLRFYIGQWHHDSKQIQCLTWEHQNSVDVVSRCFLSRPRFSLESMAVLSVWWSVGDKLHLKQLSSPNPPGVTFSTVRWLTYACS